MGINAQDLTPNASYGATVQTPGGKPDLSKYFQVSRTDTAANIVKSVLQGSCSPIGVTLYGSSVSNAATTATVTITISDNSGTRSTGTYDVKTNGAVTGSLTMTNFPLLQSVPANGDLKIVAQYAETGTASSSGGPWNMRILYAP